MYSDELLSEKKLNDPAGNDSAAQTHRIDQTDNSNYGTSKPLTPSHSLPGDVEKYHIVFFGEHRGIYDEQ